MKTTRYLRARHSLPVESPDILHNGHRYRHVPFLPERRPAATGRIKTDWQLGNIQAAAPMPLTSPGNDDDTGENHQPTLRKNTAEPVEQTLKQNSAPPSLRSPASLCLLFPTDVAQHRSRSMWRTISPPAIPRAYRPRAAREMPSRCGPRHRDSGTRRRPRRGVVSNPRGSPATADGSHPMPGGSRRPRRIPCRTPPPLRPETRPGAPWTRRVARRQAARKGRDTFSGSSPHALRARTTRKTAVGRFQFPRPTSLPPLPARPRCMRLTRRKARHKGGPQSLRSKT